jgi:primosomal protein N' (replication factor Y) (superfamily II helicase)
MDDFHNTANVAIPIPVDMTFTYRLPDRFLGQDLFGRRMLVPFRKKIRAGFIVEDSSEPFQKDELLEGIDIPDEPPFLTRDLWHFIRWIAKYYMIPVGTVLRTALPPGSNRKSKPWAIITEEGRRRLQAEVMDGKLDPGKKFIKSGYIPLAELETILGSDAFKKARSMGWFNVEERIARPIAAFRKRPFPELLTSSKSTDHSSTRTIKLTDDQAAAVSALSKSTNDGGFKPYLLFGVTGSGKTEVYLRAIEETLQRGQKALLMVPEIALTVQSARKFISYLGGPVSLFHSGLTPAQRLDEWRKIISGNVSVVIGTRSSVFVPMDNLGIIIVDEEHDLSYKQEDSCPYNARDMALARGKLCGARVVLGSATPSLESYENTIRGKIDRISLPSRYHGGLLPKVEIVDMKTHKDGEHMAALLSKDLIEAIDETLSQDRQALIFLNRRGFDTYAQCRSCGYVFKCINCDVTLTHHKSLRQLRCHLCGTVIPAPPLCPECSGDKLHFGGVGTQKIEEVLSEIFPRARIERLDRDSVGRTGELEGILDRFGRREIDILLGTQMLVKGHDYSGISLVGILCADFSLHFPDFRSAERTFQMITQVAGRTDRDGDGGKVILQTFDPNNETIKLASSQEYELFFENESVFRKELSYPPHGHLILLRIEGRFESRVETAAKQICRAIRLSVGESEDVMVLGPAPSPRKKAEGKYRWQVLLKGLERRPLRNAVQSLLNDGWLKFPGTRVTLDVDPQELI